MADFLNKEINKFSRIPQETKIHAAGRLTGSDIAGSIGKGVLKGLGTAKLISPFVQIGKGASGLKTKMNKTSSPKKAYRKLNKISDKSLRNDFGLDK